MLALKAVDVSMSYGSGASKREVLGNFSMEIAEGEFVAMMGPSGSGKTTFLHIAAALLVPDSGTVEIGGTVVSSLGDAAAARFRRRHEGVVFQSYNLIESLTVAENVTLPAKLDSKKADAARVGELLGRLDLAGRENDLPGNLSGGERQRVAIARALYMNPRIVLADEPTGNLDVASARSLCSLLGEMNKSEKCAVLMVTHDPVVAASADRVCFLDGGRIVSSCATEHDPAVVSARYLETYG